MLLGFGSCHNMHDDPESDSLQKRFETRIPYFGFAPAPFGARGFSPCLHLRVRLLGAAAAAAGGHITSSKDKLAEQHLLLLLRPRSTLAAT